MVWLINNGTMRMGPCVDDCGRASEYAPSESSSEVTSQEDRIAWLAHDRGSMEGTLSTVTSQEDLIAWSAHDRGPVEGTLSASDDVMTLQWVRETTPEVHHRSEDRLTHDAPQNPVHSYKSPSTESQDLDVAQATKELADIAFGQFLSSHQRQSNKRLFIPWQSQNRKRPKIMQSSDQLEVLHTSDSDDGETVLVKKTKFFACPFYIRNNDYTKCVTRNHLDSIEEVKEHVCWEHRRPMFCPVCKEKFPSGKHRDAHIRLRTCRANTSPTPEGITDDQEDRLNREEKSLLSEDLQWFQIWDTIFPHVQRPSSAFYTGERELSVCAFRQFWMQSGEKIVADFHEKKNRQSYSIQNEERKLRAIYDDVVEKVVDRIFADFSDAGES